MIDRPEPLRESGISTGNGYRQYIFHGLTAEQAVRSRSDRPQVLSSLRQIPQLLQVTPKMLNCDHWLITRFNIPMRSQPGRSTDRDWLEHRLRLFSSYCLPSVAHQSCQDFRWLLLMDRDTPASFFETIEQRQRQDNLRILPVTSAWKNELAAYLAQECHSEYLVTSRLDNDDAIHRHFIQATQAAINGQKFQFFDVPCGLKLDELRCRLFRFMHVAGPFVSLVERVDGLPKTVYCCNHSQVSQLGPVCRLMLNPGWLQVVHDRNVHNRIEPALRRVPFSQLGVDFPGLSITC